MIGKLRHRQTDISCLHPFLLHHQIVGQIRIAGSLIFHNIPYFSIHGRFQQPAGVKRPIFNDPGNPQELTPHCVFWGFHPEGIIGKVHLYRMNHAALLQIQGQLGMGVEIVRAPPGADILIHSPLRMRS